MEQLIINALVVNLRAGTTIGLDVKALAYVKSIVSGTDAIWKFPQKHVWVAQKVPGYGMPKTDFGLLKYKVKVISLAEGLDLQNSDT